MKSSKISRTTAILLLSIFVICPKLNAANFAAYIPGGVGSYWTYVNVEDPGDWNTVSIFEQFIFDGKPAAKYGTDPLNYSIGYNDGSAVHLYGEVSGGILYDFDDVSIGDFNDGKFMNLADPTNWVLLRMWDDLDASAQSQYGFVPDIDDLVLWVSYDTEYSKNDQNAHVESNLPPGETIPDYAVTHLEWYQLGIGSIIDLDIDAATGNLEERYELVDYRIVPLPASVWLLGSCLLCLAGLRQKFK